MKIKLKHFNMACLASVAVLLGACSNGGEIKADAPAPKVAVKAADVASESTITKPANEPEVVVKAAPKVVAKAPVVQRQAPLKVAKVAPPKPVVSKPVVKAKAYVPPKPIVVKVHQPKPAVKVAKKVQPAPQIRVAQVPRKAVQRPAVVTKPAAVRQVSYRPQPARVTKKASYNHYSQSTLTGDFAGNPQAVAFINMMVNRHGFDRNYVTGVLSRAEATKWLKRMAYSDANPQLRKKSGGAPNWTRYRSRFITAKHINTGTAFWNKHRRTLERAANQYGVPEEYILGIMGVETIYGGNVGTDRAIDALTTMSFMNSRRGKYFASELESYLLMTRSTGLDPLKPKASYAGALGLPQFMPSNIKKYGVDYDGDGGVNLWTPVDAIGSVANYLNKHGWRRGEIAAIPAIRTGGNGYASLKSGFKHKHSLATLARRGLKPSYPGVSGPVNMIKLNVTGGQEYWIGGNNFYVITRYNHSTHYAMAVHELAQEIKKRVKPGQARTPLLEASRDKDLLMRAAGRLL